MSTSRMIAFQIISLFPLVNIIFIIYMVVVMIIMPFTYLKIFKSESSCKSTEILDI